MLNCLLPTYLVELKRGEIKSVTVIYDCRLGTAYFSNRPYQRCLNRTLS